MSNPSLDHFKEMARKLHSYLKEKGINIPYSHCLEATARQVGFPSWQVLNAKVEPKSSEGPRVEEESSVYTAFIPQYPLMSSILLMVGAPGSGKTVISRNIIKKAIESNSAVSIFGMDSFYNLPSEFPSVVSYGYSDRDSQNGTYSILSEIDSIEEDDLDLIIPILFYSAGCKEYFEDDYDFVRAAISKVVAADGAITLQELHDELFKGAVSKNVGELGLKIKQSISRDWQHIGFHLLGNCSDTVQLHKFDMFTVFTAERDSYLINVILTKIYQEFKRLKKSESPHSLMVLDEFNFYISWNNPHLVNFFCKLMEKAKGKVQVIACCQTLTPEINRIFKRSNVSHLIMKVYVNSYYDHFSKEVISQIKTLGLKSGMYSESLIISNGQVSKVKIPIKLD